MCGIEIDKEAKERKESKKGGENGKEVATAAENDRKEYKWG